MLPLLLLATPAHAEPPPPSPIVKTEFVSDTASVEAGRVFELGVLLSPFPEWHTYWENPGDAGLATTLTWTLPPGFTAGSIDWPPPERIAEGTLVTYSYSGDVFLPVTITPPATLDASSLTFKVKAEWLVCKDICIPESAEHEITLPTGPHSPSGDNDLFAQHDLKRATPLAATAASDDKSLTVSVPLTATGLADVATAHFMPRQEGVIQYAAEQTLSVQDGQVSLTILRAESGKGGDLSGILELQTASGETKFFDIRFSIPAAATAAEEQPQPPAEAPFLPYLLLVAVLGGAILNLMPCVLPVLSLKAIAIAKKRGRERAKTLPQGLAYTAGIMLSFGLIAGVLLALKAGGEAVGWGYQMQSPAFVGFLIYLLFLVGLNLSGLFHLPVLLGNVGNIDENSIKGSFFTGVLATAVATPCTAPFMATAVGVALTLPAWQSLLIFEALGFGLALPFLLLSIFPRSLRFLPKPGAWMEKLKHLLALPMYASVVWLLWVLYLQTGLVGLLTAITGMMFITLSIGAARIKSSRGAIIAAMLIVAATTGLLGHLEPPGMAVPAASEGIPYSKERLAELRAAGTPVFIDATAAWCLTCQLNARAAIHTDATRALFKERGIVLMIADWTRRNEDITAFLSGFGYSGVPLYVYYPAGGEGAVLPQLLTETIVRNAITGEQ